MGWREYRTTTTTKNKNTTTDHVQPRRQVVGTLKAIFIPALGPAFTALTLLKLSGIPIIQRKYDRLYGDREDYRRWRRETPLLIPIPRVAWLGTRSSW